MITSVTASSLADDVGRICRIKYQAKLKPLYSFMLILMCCVAYVTIGSSIDSVSTAGFT
jgi:hypothetical protein